jgi:hypothetical protein
VTSEQLDLSSKIQAARERLEATWVVNRDNQAGQDAVAEARRILDRLQSPAPSSAGPLAVFRLLRVKIAEILRDPANLERVANAMNVR